ncbi:nitroreductase family deazaflavin-dependent oxidoreductase [Microbacterium fluvii]|uniref:Nitroreductase family deazaflavin-dependent oxidoreductase n=1 Tax=Microbacterium fluvii TaxID=415215 RepID=A0ABW2H946_9MICO|nr:nitroreductase family deazaflavin-dependent oxidoreductase [Microbacterium fluvii]MCU4671250.1 nitroreductase family deazaflavin-dependent oxidoreductase [Microbacterium fluvii]
MGERFVKPTAMDAAFNKAVGWFTRMGMPMAGSRVLAVRGRSSGQWRTTPVNPLRVAGSRYLVGPRGHAQWTKNLRASGEGELRVGRRVERFTAVEVPDHEKPPILRAYLKAWAWEVDRFFEHLDADATDAELLIVAPGVPVFRIDPA